MDIRKKLECILENLKPGQDLSSCGDFIDDGILDSFDILNLINDLESEFDTVIPPMEIKAQNFGSVDALCTLIKKCSRQ